ncbi:hypothetical protein EMIT0P291_110051 [Pseudomonas sp. IT-P291]
MRIVSGESFPGPLLATAWVCSFSNVRCRSVGSTGPRLMRGHILGPAFRCLSGVGRSLQACRATRVNRLLVHGCQSSVLGELNNAGGRYMPEIRPHWL